MAVTPGIGTTRTAAARQILLSDQGKMLLPGGRIVDGAESRDALNTGNLDVLRAGMVLGKITTGDKWAPSIIGVGAEALDGDETTFTVTAATAVEIVRRIGTTGTFKMTGPPTAAGVVRTATITFSAIDTTTGVITITAIEAASTWTLTEEATEVDGGTFRIKVTTPAGTFAQTDALAWNASAATIETAVEALAGVGAGNGTVSGSWPMTITFEADLGDMQVEVVNDCTADGGALEGGLVVEQTVIGIDGRWVIGCLLRPTDGSEAPLALLGDAFGLKVTGVAGANADVYPDEMLIGGFVDASQIVNWPADASLRTWLHDQLNTSGQFVFDNAF